MESALCSELLGQHVSHGEYITLAVVVHIKDGGYFHSERNSFAVLALAIFKNVLVLFFNETTIGANTPGCVESLRIVSYVSLVGVLAACTCVVSEEHISDVLGLSGLAGSGDLDLVFAFLKGYLEAVYVSTDQEIVAPKLLGGVIKSCGGIVAPTVGVLDLLFTVNKDSCFTISCILQTDVDSEIVNASLGSSYLVKQVAVFLVAVGYVEVSVRKLGSVAALSLVVLTVVYSGKAINLCIDVENALSSEHFGQHVSHGEYITLAVVVHIKDGGYFHGERNCFAVFALAIFKNVLVLCFNEIALGANAPGCVEALLVVSYVSLVAVAESCCKYFVTYGTGLSSGAVCCFAGGVAESCYEYFVTYGTGLSSGAGCCFAGGVLAGCRNLFGFGCATTFSFTGVGYFACCNTSGGNSYLTCIPSVSYNGNVHLGDKDFTALGALFTGSLTGGGTSGCYCRNRLLSMYVFGVLGCGRFGCGFFRFEQITRSDRKHQDHSKNYSQNAKNVFSLHTKKPP